MDSVNCVRRAFSKAEPEDANHGAGGGLRN